MSTALSALAWDVDLPSPEMRLVMLKLCDNAGPDGTAPIRRSHLARQTGLSPEHLDEMLTMFRHAGVLIHVSSKADDVLDYGLNVRALDDLAWGERIDGTPKPPKMTFVVSSPLESGPTAHLVSRALLNREEPDRK